MTVVLGTRFEKYVVEQRLFRKGERILVGVSGGPDSTVLLHLLHALRVSWDLHLTAVHLNHGLRGRESDADERAVRSLCRSLDVPLSVARRCVRSAASKQRMSLEEAGREARHRLFSTLCRRLGTRTVALGHTADDRVETVLMFLLRGAGRHGLAGISSRREFPDKGMTVIRPLLPFWKEELLDHLGRARLPFRNDASNRSLDFLRNRIRRSLIPLLQRYNPRIKDRLLALATMFEGEEDYLRALSVRWLDRHASGREGNAGIPLKVFRGLPLPLRSRVLRLMMDRSPGGVKGIAHAHMERLLQLTARDAGERDVTLPAGRTARRTYGRLHFPQTPSAAFRDRPDKTLRIPGRAGPITLRIVRRPVQYGDPRREYFDLDRLDLPLRARGWRPGDALEPFGMSGHKKIQDLLVDLKVPRSQRGAVRLVVDRSGKVLWVAGYRRSRQAMIVPGTRRILELRYDAPGSV